MPIQLNDLLKLDDLINVKIRLLKSYEDTNPLELFKSDPSRLSHWLFYNYSKNKSFKEGQTVIGLVKISVDKWLLFDISRVTKDLNVLKGKGYEHETIAGYKKYLGRVIVHYKNKSQNMIRNASSMIDECLVSSVLESQFEDDLFPGYENVSLPWRDLKRVIENSSWKTALENQKGVYLITDKSNGKNYIGSAYGSNMLYGRWMAYIKNGHGGNQGLKKLNFKHIQDNFIYSILEIYKYTTNDDIILQRESWWKRALLSRDYGYNQN